LSQLSEYRNDAGGAIAGSASRNCSSLFYS
jgi:hypothetical protein